MPQSSLALTAFGAGMSGMAQQQSGAYQAQIARNNQVIANQNADLAEFKGNQQVGVARERTAQMVGAQVAAGGASGVDVNSGSPLRAQQDTARIGEMDAQTILANAKRSAWGYRVQAQNFGDEAEMASRRGNMGLFSSLIGGASTYADKWQKYVQQGGG